MNRNPATVNGTPTLATGLLTVDQDQALTFNGTTNSATAPDSTTLSQTGSMSLEALIKIPSVPGSTKDLVAKSNSYALQINSSGKLLWHLDSGGGTVTVTSATTIASGTAYHVVGVYNGEYTGVQQFGRTTEGTVPDQQYLADDTKYVTAFTMPERGLINTVYASVEYADEIHPLTLRAVVYTDSGGTPTDLVCQSEEVSWFDNSIWRNPTFIPFTVAGLADPGTHWVGIMGTDPYPNAGMAVSGNATGGTTKSGSDSVSDGASDPFGTVASTTAANLDIYATYTAVGRSGLEGKALLYINGALDASSGYTAGISNNGTALNFGTAVAVTLDEVSLWDRALSPVEIATHYTAR